MLGYKINKKIDLNDDSPTCKTAKDVIEAVLSYSLKVFPEMNLEPEINKLAMTGMNLSQIAYSIAKVTYSTVYEASNNALENEATKIGLDYNDMSEKNMDKIEEIVDKYDSQFGVFHFMYFKSISEELMVNTAFQIFEGDPKIKKILAKDDHDFNKIKKDWKKYPSISKKIIDLSFKLRV